MTKLKGNSFVSRLQYRLIAILFFCFPFVYSGAQTNNQNCLSKEISQFDFWVGDWDITWGDTLHGTNHVEKMFGNCTLQENFNDPKNNYSGKSWDGV
jgi:hypothetical protein